MAALRGGSSHVAADLAACASGVGVALRDAAPVVELRGPAHLLRRAAGQFAADGVAVAVLSPHTLLARNEAGSKAVDVADLAGSDIVLRDASAAYSELILVGRLAHRLAASEPVRSLAPCLQVADGPCCDLLVVPAAAAAQARTRVLVAGVSLDAIAVSIQAAAMYRAAQRATTRRPASTIALR